MTFSVAVPSESSEYAATMSAAPSIHGASPALAKCLRNQVVTQLDERIAEVLADEGRAIQRE